MLDTPDTENVQQNVIFNKFDQVEFPFVDQVSLSLDHVVDICFEGVAKLKYYQILVNLLLKVQFIMCWKKLAMEFI